MSPTDPLFDRLVMAVGTQYLVEAEIGRGGMAAVYRAMDLRLQRQVAIKVLPPELAFNADVRERFLREAQTAAQLTHPSIVPIYSVGEPEGIVYFVMALVEGESLAERLVREPRLPISEARRILAVVADALAYAHSKGVVHRDVKPDNIMLDRASGRPMVTDFGIARAAQGDTRLTVTGVAIGTPAYMSPEQALGERELDGRSDIYSLGVIGYQLLAGETPFRATNTPAMLVKHVSETPRPLSMLRPDVPSGLAHAIARALAKKPEERWADAAEFREALLDQREAPAQAAPAWSPPRDPQPSSYRAPQPPPLPASRSQAQESSFLEPFGAPRPAWMPPLPPMPPAPVWGGKSEWRDWRKSKKQWERAQRRYAHEMRTGSGNEEESGLSVDERLVRFRRTSVGSVGTIAMLGAINVMFSPHFFWFLFPSAFMALGIFRRAGSLWADGVPFSRMLGRGNADQLHQPALGPVISHESVSDAASRLAGPDVLAGPYGDMVRRAASDHVSIRDTLRRLPETERAMIPDVAPTVDSLAQRVGALATTLHRLDSDIGGTSAKMLDARVAAVRAETRGSPTPDQERRIAMLERQRTSIAELSDRRAALATQLESAALALQNLRLDILKLRSSGLESAISDVSSATQEARALSREIGNAVEAMREVRRL